MKRIIILALLTVSFHFSFATVYYVSTSGNDGSGNGSAASPWRTLKHAVSKVPANQGHVIKLSAGTFVESGQFNVPAGVSVEGAGMDQTIIKAASSFHFNPGDPGFAIDRFLMTLSSGSATNGNQTLKNFSIDGDGKRLHGGIYVKFRNNVTIEDVKVQFTNFCGIWLWDVKSTVVRDVKLINCSWGSTGWASGALMLAHIDGATIDNINIDENTGYGVKALSSGGNKISRMKVSNSRISVNPAGKWNNGSAANISFELWEVLLTDCEIYNTYFDNHLSLVNVQTNPTGGRSIRVHHNTFDLKNRANGHGYGIELSINDAEIDNNWFNGGNYGIAHWSPAKCSNWSIHHNTFTGLSSGYPGTVVRAQVSGLHNVKFFNNTVELSGTSTINVFGLHGGRSENVQIKNNLIIDANTSYSWWANPLIFTENGASLSGFQVTNNHFQKMPVGSVGGASYANNTAGDARISKTGSKPAPYFVPANGSPLIDAGVDVGFPYKGARPDIGAYESGHTSSVAVSGISVSPTTLNLTVDETAQLSAEIAPANATNKNVTWTSDNTSIATVNSSGLVTTKAAGTAVITARSADGGKTASTKVTVTSSSVAVTGISVSPTSLTLDVNATRTLTSTVAPSNATDKTVTWSTSNGSVATVSHAGVVTAKSKGSATISATTNDGKKVATASVTVNDNAGKGNDNDDANTSEGLIVDDATKGSNVHQFNYAGDAWTNGVSSGDPYHNQTVSFSNQPNNTATVNFTGTKVELYSAKAAHHGIVAVSIDNGPETMVDLYSASRQDFALVYGSAVLSHGNHTIKMRVTGNKNSAATGTYVIIDYIKVYAGAATAVTGVSVSPATFTIGIDEKKQLTKTVTPTSASNQNVTWSSSDNKVAVVSASGIVTGVSEGKATITVKTADGNKTSTAQVTVTSPSNAVEFDDADRGTAMNKFNFSGSGWVFGKSTSDPYLNMTVSYSNVVNDFVSITFVGNRVDFFSAKAPHHGIVSVSIDNGPEELVDLYAASRENFANVFSSEGLTQGEHTIKIRVTGSKNSAATGAYAIIDYVKVYSTAAGGGAGASLMAAAEAPTEPMQYYPNPLRSGDALYVDVPEVEGEVLLMDLAGTPLRTLSVTETSLTIPTDGLNKGIYLLEYRTAKGREVVRIIVQ